MIIPITADYSSGAPVAGVEPWIITKQELDCMRESLPFENHVIDPNRVETQIDFSESYYLPTHLYESYEVRFTPHGTQTAIRIMLGYANAKITLTRGDRSGVVAESKP